MTTQAAPRLIRVHTNNDVLQTLHALQHNRSKRTARREFLVEGVRAINQAVAHGWHIRAFIHSAERALSDWAQGLLRRGLAAQEIVLDDALMRELSARDETSELMACIAMRQDDPAQISARADARCHAASNATPLVVLLDRPASPGNLGSLIRSCDALGADGVLITGHAADIYEPECVRASTGSLFALPVVRIHQQEVLNNWLTDFTRRWPLLQRIGTDEHGTQRIDQQPYERPTLLLLGNETWGLSAANRASCDLLVRIPMSGAASSLNLACAGSIVLYEIGRQRGVLGEPR